MPGIRWLGVMVLVACVLAATPSLAQGEAARLGVIDMQLILRESKAVQALSSKVESLRSEYRAERSSMEEQFRSADQELARDRKNLSEDAYERRLQGLEERAAKLQQEFQSRRKRLDQIFGQGMAKVQETLIEVARDVATEQEIDLLLAKDTVVLVKPDLEITNEVLQRLDRNLPDIALPEIEK